MRGPYGFSQTESCQNCTLRGAGFFCQLPPAAVKDLNAVKSTSVYPKGAVLFLEGQEPRGVFVLCEGRVKLSMSSSDGKTLILRIVNAGEVLGLTASISGDAYEVTAETLHPSQVAFVRRDDFLRFVAEHPEASASVARELNSNYKAACEQLRTLGLSATAPEKLARLLLEWSDAGQGTKQGTRIKVSLTHEEIAALIGTTRETVTRTLSDFKHRHLVTLQGATLMIPNRKALESFAGA
jgi:CRP/FNR family transcriptional regulator, cyclic AMP receptor protein